MFFKSKRKGSSEVVGLALTPEKISIALVAWDQGQAPQLKLLDSVSGSRSISQAQALTELVKKHHLTDLPCNLVLEQVSYSLLQIEAPDVDASELSSAVRWQIQDQLVYDASDAIIDTFEVPGQDQSGRTKLIYVAAAHAPQIHVQAEQIKKSGLQLNAIDISELALRNIAALTDEDATGAGILHLSDTHSLLNLTKQSNVYLTRSLGTNLNQLSHIEESTIGAADTETEQTRRLDDIILEIQRSLGYYESYFSLPPISSLMVNPTEPVLPNFINYADTHLGIPVHLLDLNKLLDVEKPLEADEQAHGLLAIGAALRNEGGRG